ncbi:hypothetical protein F5Y14DRAFT_217817 [Nemania sp. NC0429]|nr:hypothetical protein F5Y14DRAFT_217817 [Nemania sp. NC0429]
MSTLETQVGSPEAAQDLYGLGVRVGFYLQALGMILYNYGNGEDYGKGLKLASGSITLSILASWFVFAAYQSFSPSEAVIVLLVLISLSFPAKATLLNPRTIADETTGLIILVIVELGTCSALLWTFARLVNTLPTFGTDNVVFFFAKVAINGWFRILALVYCVIDAATSILLVSKVSRVIAMAWGYRSGNVSRVRNMNSESSAMAIPAITAASTGNLILASRAVTSPRDDEAIPPLAPSSGEAIKNDGLESEIIKIMNWDNMKSETRYLGWLIWILVVVAVELTVRWNHLSPSTDLRAPGQLIPFITGIIIFIDSIFIVARQLWPHREALFFKFIAATLDHINTSLSSLSHVEKVFSEWRKKVLASTFALTIIDSAKNISDWLGRKFLRKRRRTEA